MLLADEVNRAPAKTQSALLEAMQENQVTIEGTTLPLPQPFMVLATQNPIEQEGVYRLPEAQLDRFLLRVDMGYPQRFDEMAMLRLHSHPVAPAEQLFTAEQILDIQWQVATCMATIRCWSTSSIWPTPAAIIRTWPSAPVRAPPCVCLRLRRARALLDGRLLLHA